MFPRRSTFLLMWLVLFPVRPIWSLERVFFNGTFSAAWDQSIASVRYVARLFKTDILFHTFLLTRYTILNYFHVFIWNILCKFGMFIWYVTVPVIVFFQKGGNQLFCWGTLKVRTNQGINYVQYLICVHSKCINSV